MGAAGGKGRIRGEGGLHASWTLQGGLSLQQDELESNQLLMKVFKLGNGNNRSKGKFVIADCTQELSSLQKWEVTHQSVIPLWPITGEVNNTYLYVIKWVNILSSKLVLEAGKTSKREYLSEVDKGQIMMARTSPELQLVGCSWSSVVSTYQKWFKEWIWEAEAHWSLWGAKGGLCGLIQQTSYFSLNCRKG